MNGRTVGTFEIDCYIAGACPLVRDAGFDCTLPVIRTYQLKNTVNDKHN